MQNNPIFPRGKNPFKPFMSYSGIFYCLWTGKQEEPINGACYVALDVPTVQNNTYRLKIQL